MTLNAGPMSYTVKSETNRNNVSARDAILADFVGIMNANISIIIRIIGRFLRDC